MMFDANANIEGVEVYYDGVDQTVMVGLILTGMVTVMIST